MERSDRPSKSTSANAGLLTISDGHAGNVRQVDALARALGHPAVRDCRLQARWPWRLWAPRLGPASERAFGADFRGVLDAPPMLALGCGRQAALATRLLSARGSRVVQILDPRLDPRHWDLVVAPVHDGLRGANVLSLVGSLNPVDDAWLSHARACFPGFASLPQPRTTVLLGGPSRHVALSPPDLLQLAAQVRAATEHDGGSVLLTTSRRTPTSLRDRLREIFASVPGCVWTGSQDGDNPYPGLLAWADRIVCSPDSVNMISEACATQVPVHVFEPQRARGRLRLFLDSLSGSGRIAAMRDALAAFDVVPLRETNRIALQVKQRLGL